IVQNITFGKWILASRLAGHLNSDLLILWLLVFVLGQKAAGFFAACVTIAHFSNPFVLGIGQILTPLVSRTFTEKGVKQMDRLVRVASVIIAVVLLCYCIAILLFGDALLLHIYGLEYGGHNNTLTVLTLAVLAFALSIPPTNGIWVFEKPNLTFITTVVGLSLTLLLATTLVHYVGILGVACGLFTGKAITTCMRWILFIRLSKKHRAVPLQSKTV
ncbi:MAG: hypothetical protein GY697_27800, partial [Desulfobacterales bacterium]|nr:hypothetical protein [Desulfobacterales bacterium]